LCLVIINSLFMWRREDWPVWVGAGGEEGGRWAWQTIVANRLDAEDKGVGEAGYRQVSVDEFAEEYRVWGAM
jgi:hypothetical protein